MGETKEVSAIVDEETLYDTGKFQACHGIYFRIEDLKPLIDTVPIISVIQGSGSSKVTSVGNSLI